METVSIADVQAGVVCTIRNGTHRRPWVALIPAFLDEVYEDKRLGHVLVVRDERTGRRSKWRCLTEAEREAQYGVHGRDPDGGDFAGLTFCDVPMKPGVGRPIQEWDGAAPSLRVQQTGDEPAKVVPVQQGDYCGAPLVRKRIYPQTAYAVQSASYKDCDLIVGELLVSEPRAFQPVRPMHVREGGDRLDIATVRDMLDLATSEFIIAAVRDMLDLATSEFIAAVVKTRRAGSARSGRQLLVGLNMRDCRVARMIQAVKDPKTIEWLAHYARLSKRGRKFDVRHVTKAARAQRRRVAKEMKQVLSDRKVGDDVAARQRLIADLASAGMLTPEQAQEQLEKAAHDFMDGD
jgi:hypothetical protein